ncbi:MAG: sodium:proton antiporter, partial [Aliifodinibius sp.]|nr:Na+/H+ antiporter NhaA [Candidatus Dadabacteria bacterium]NIT58431.1 Na+/H+ antiporter NhaA [Fodinibius sp.]NIV13294.1 sodium:proton antiporter [Fodinibius sp.]NIY27014.1 sodium:proton antiporter [Fodinibius sp.]
IAGGVLAFTIPLHRRWSVEKLKEYAREGFDLFDQAATEDLPVTEKQAVEHLNKAHLRFESPLKRLERKLHTPVYFGIMPLFAFANAGIVLSTEIMGQAFYSPLIWGIMVGLFV